MAQFDKMQSRRNFRNLWHSDLMSTINVDCPFCCFACFCAPCASYILRKRALYNDLTRYECCAGYMPCSGRCMESHCPTFCLCTEVSFCFASSVSSTRFLLQDEFNIQNAKCDNCLIAFMLIVDQISCIFSIIACILGSDELKELAHILRCIAEMVYCTVCACMQTQHKIEMDKRDGMFGPEAVMGVPPVQMMSRMDQPMPPAIVYPPPALGQPYYPPPPFTSGYPPTVYPPPAPVNPYAQPQQPPSPPPPPPPHANPYK